MKFIGLQNYIRLFTIDDVFKKSLFVTLKYVLIAVPLKLLFALFIAMIVNIKLRFINIFSTLYYLPSILGGSVAIAILWRTIFSREGVVNSFLPFQPVDWLGNPDVALFTLGLLIVWQFGSSMVLFLAGLKNIPKEYYDSAKIDGAGTISTYFNITLPMLSPIIFFNLIMQMVYAFQEFTAPAIITGGGPLKETYLYTLMIYDTGFKYMKMGYACAQSWIMFVIIVLLTSIIFKSSVYWTHYEDGGDF
jgi:oligogalacturonide transport system permease protein